VLNNRTASTINNIEVNIESKVLTKYINKNICGYIPGKINNDTMVIFSAHYDHLGGMGKATFFPGANDNASGVSVLLNLVKYYTKNPPKYKTLFIFFAGEEAGLLGSKYFVESKVVDLKKIKFLVNFDLLGTGDEGIMVVNGYTFEKQFGLLESINKEKNLVKEIKRRGKASNSDHYWFSEAGVPCFFIYTLGGIKAYHDVYDVAKTLPLTDYVDVFKLVTEFTDKL
jgi:Zn-dependent M28 family amino/carboxypeptidase